LIAGDVTVAVKAFATAILHGDDEHRRWLLEAADAFLAGMVSAEVRGVICPNCERLRAEKRDANSYADELCKSIPVHLANGERAGLQRAAWKADAFEVRSDIPSAQRRNRRMSVWDTDYAGWLRDMATRIVSGSTVRPCPKALTRAADEISRLRAELRTRRGGIDDEDQCRGN